MTKEGYMTDRAVSGGCVGNHCVGGRTSNILSPVPGHQREDKKKKTNQFFAANSSSMDVG
jgi:hypothetical protein